MFLEISKEYLSTFNRQIQTQLYNELRRNSWKGSVLDQIQKDYQFIAGEKIQDMFATNQVDLVNNCYKDIWKLDVVQIL